MGYLTQQQHLVVLQGLSLHALAHDLKCCGKRCKEEFRLFFSVVTDIIVVLFLSYIFAPTVLQHPEGNESNHIMLNND